MIKRWLKYSLLLFGLVTFLGSESLTAQKKHQISKPQKPAIRVMTIGHVGHGKTTLTAAITKILSKTGRATFIPYDKLANPPTTKVRGVKVAAAQVKYRTDKGSYEHVDCQSPSDCLELMTARGAKFSGVVLVVSLADGPMPQTREHIQLAHKMGVPSITVYLNKVDLINDEKLSDLVELEVRELLSASGFPGDKVAVIRGSAQMALEGRRDDIGKNSIVHLLNAMDETYFGYRRGQLPKRKRVNERAVTPPFLMPIEDIFTIQGRSVVVMGRVERGNVNVNEPVEIVGIQPTKQTVVTGVEMFKKLLDKAVAGDNVGLLLKGVEQQDVERGQVIAKPGSIKPHTKFRANVDMLKKEEGGRNTPFFTGYRPQVFLRTTDVTGVVNLPSRLEMVMPGDKNIEVDVELIVPIALKRGLRFAIREGGRTVGTGVITDIIK